MDFTAECGASELEMVQHYSQGLMSALMALLSGGSLQQQRAAIPAVSAMASALQGQFALFYPQLLPSFLSILASVHNPDTRCLRGPTMECISW